MSTVHPQRQRTWLGQRPAAAKVPRRPAAVPLDRRPLARLRAWCRRMLFPEAPRPAAAPGQLEWGRLAISWHRCMHFAGAGNIGSTLDDMLWQARTWGALQILLEDYRAGRAQSAEERILAESLDYVARVYLKA